MHKRLRTGFAFAASLGLTSAAAAPAVNNSVDRHILAAKAAAGLDFPGIFMRLCVEPVSGYQDEAGGPQIIPVLNHNPPRANWYARPMKVYDNLYFVGTRLNSAWALKTSQGIILIDTLFHYAVEPEIIDGLKTLGLDPAQIKYVIISHGHGDHDEGAKLLQDRYHAHIIAGGPDWDFMGTPAADLQGGLPTRDMVATDGQKITLGDGSVTLYLTPGHTPGTLSYIFNVTDHGKPVTVVYSGGTAYNFPFTRANFNQYIAMQEKMAKIAADAGASVLLSNHNEFDGAYTRSLEMSARQPGDANPFDIGAKGVARYFTVAEECTRAALDRIYP